jgi:hypothetical protein
MRMYVCVCVCVCVCMYMYTILVNAVTVKSERPVPLILDLNDDVTVWSKARVYVCVGVCVRMCMYVYTIQIQMKYSYVLPTCMHAHTPT